MKPGHGDPAVNTTLAIVATDAVLSKAQAHRMTEVAQTGLARAIHPAHTVFDGDLVFAVSTEARPLPEPPALAELVLGHAAALCLARAIARAVHAARPAPGDLLPCWADTGGVRQDRTLE
jgi:D-aminopeptidase